VDSAAIISEDVRLKLTFGSKEMHKRRSSSVLKKSGRNQKPKRKKKSQTKSSLSGNICQIQNSANKKKCLLFLSSIRSLSGLNCGISIL
jgi:hypothetical protein